MFCSSEDRKESSVLSFQNRAPLKGVISVISWDVAEIKNIPRVIDVRWMNRVANEEKLRVSVLLFF
jgi:hypothetical protein